MAKYISDMMIKSCPNRNLQCPAHRKIQALGLNISKFLSLEDLFWLPFSHVKFLLSNQLAAETWPENNSSKHWGLLDLADLKTDDGKTLGNFTTDHSKSYLLPFYKNYNYFCPDRYEEKKRNLSEIRKQINKQT